jgi:hypothetical protein
MTSPTWSEPMWIFTKSVGERGVSLLDRVIRTPLARRRDTTSAALERKPSTARATVTSTSGLSAKRCSRRLAVEPTRLGLLANRGCR